MYGGCLFKFETSFSKNDTLWAYFIVLFKASFSYLFVVNDLVNTLYF